MHFVSLPRVPIPRLDVRGGEAAPCLEAGEGSGEGGVDGEAPAGEEGGGEADLEPDDVLPGGCGCG